MQKLIKERIVLEHRDNIDTQAWIFQCWASFSIALLCTIGGVFYLPTDNWVKGFLGMGIMFLVGSTFSLAKTLRDNHEARKTINRMRSAKAEKLIREFEEPAKVPVSD